MQASNQERILKFQISPELEKDIMRFLAGEALQVTKMSRQTETSMRRDQSHLKNPPFHRLSDSTVFLLTLPRQK